MKRLLVLCGSLLFSAMALAAPVFLPVEGVQLAGAPLLNQLNLKGLPANHAEQGSWIGLYPASAANTEYGYLTYVYSRNLQDGKIAMDAPAEPGPYELRFFERNGASSASEVIAISVVARSENDTILAANKPTYSPLEKISFQASVKGALSQRAWVGVFPADSQKDLHSNYLSYLYIARATPPFTMSAPEKPGHYQLRFFDGEVGSLLKQVNFEVADYRGLNAKIGLSKKDVEPEQPFSFSFLAHKDFPDSAWVGIFEQDPNTEIRTAEGYLSYVYLRGKVEGNLALTSPSKKGEYELRMLSSERGQVVAYERFNVVRSVDADSMAEQLKQEGLLRLYGIYFDVNKSDIKPQSHTTLDALLRLLTQNLSLNVAIEGHTDAQGDDAHNLKLSKDRAKSVQNWLVQKGIAATRLKHTGKGEMSPVADNATETGRALNRRVEIRPIAGS